MNDCPNAEMRDLLPELLHDRLSATMRAEVLAHVDACADCREELELLRALRDVMASYTPKVDVGSIVNALPTPPRPGVRPLPQPRRTWADWRIAAAVTLLVVGGSSVAVMTRGAGVSRTTLVPVQASAAPNRDDSAALRVASAAGAARADAGVTVAGLADLDDTQLESLISELEQMEAVPMTEPEAVMLRVGLNPGGE